MTESELRWQAARESIENRPPAGYGPGWRDLGCKLSSDPHYQYWLRADSEGRCYSDLSISGRPGRWRLWRAGDTPAGGRIFDGKRAAFAATEHR